MVVTFTLRLLLSHIICSEIHFFYESEVYHFKLKNRTQNHPSISSNNFQEWQILASRREKQLESLQTIQRKYFSFYMLFPLQNGFVLLKLLRWTFFYPELSYKLYSYKISVYAEKNVHNIENRLRKICKKNGNNGKAILIIR